jgi:micrococcal nuclease
MRHSTDFHREVRTLRGPVRPARRRRPDFGIALLGVIAAGAVIGVTTARYQPAVVSVALPVAAPADAAGTGLRRSFGFCHSGGGTNCVVDGDTFRIDGERIRIADIDAPETHPSRCAEEARLGNAATERLQALLNSGKLTLASADRDTDKYGRKLRIVMLEGRSVGGILVGEGLAREWTGSRQPWC